MPPHNNDKSSHQGAAAKTKQPSFAAAILSTGAAGVVEAGCHPLDTWKTRYTISKEPFKPLGSFPGLPQFWQYYQRIFFAQAWDQSIASKIKSSYQGVSAGFAYKVSQRTFVNFLGLHGLPHMNAWTQSQLPQTWDPRIVSGAVGAFGGAGIGGLEALVMSPLDRIKILKILHPDAGSAWRIAKQYKLSLWDGVGLTIPRNMVGSAALWSTDTLVNMFLFDRAPGEKLAFYQHGIASALSITASIVFSRPLDVAKARVQGDKTNQLTAVKALKDVIRNGDAFRGLFISLVASGFKKTAGLSVAKWLCDHIEDFLPMIQSRFSEVETQEGQESPSVGVGANRNSLFGAAKPSARVIEAEQDETPEPPEKSM